MAVTARLSDVPGPFLNEELVGEALKPVRDRVVIATKFGFELSSGQARGLDSRPETIANIPIEDVAAAVKEMSKRARSRTFGLPEARLPRRDEALRTTERTSATSPMPGGAHGGTLRAR